MTKTKHAIVVGSGCSGLVSALLLAEAGIRVTVLERSDELAPLLRRRVLEGFEISHGFQYLGGFLPGGGLEKLFDRLGIREHVTLAPVGANGVEEFHGITAEPIVLPVGAEAVRAALAKAFPASGRALDEYFRVLDQVLADLSFEDLEGQLTRPELTTVSLQQAMQGWGAEPGLIELMGEQADFLMGVSAGECSLLLHLLGVGAYYAAAHRFEGSGGALAAALLDRARAVGIELRAGCEVVGIDREPPRRFTGVRVRTREGSETLAADAAVVTIHPKRLRALLPEALGGLPSLKRMATLPDTRAECFFNLAVEGSAAAGLERIRHHFVREAGGNLAHRISFLPDFGASLSPSGERRCGIMFSAWFAEGGPGCPGRSGAPCGAPRTLGCGPTELDGFGPELARRVAETLPEIDGRYRVIGGMSPCDLERLNGTWRGSLYGLKSTYDRLGPRFIGPLSGLYLAGQSVVAPGIFGAASSAVLASAALLERSGT